MSNNKKVLVIVGVSALVGAITALTVSKVRKVKTCLDDADWIGCDSSPVPEAFLLVLRAKNKK